MPREKKDGKYLNTYISREVVEMLDDYSKHTGVSKAFVVENAIKSYFQIAYSQGCFPSAQSSTGISKPSSGKKAL